MAPSPTPQGSAPLPAHRPLSGVERDRVVLLGLAAPEDAALLTTTRHRGLDEYPGVPQGTSWWRRLRGTGSPR